MRSRGRCSACGSAGGLAATGDEKFGRILTKSFKLGFETYLNGTLTSSIVIDIKPALRKLYQNAGSHRTAWWAREKSQLCGPTTTYRKVRAIGCFEAKRLFSLVPAPHDPIGPTGFRSSRRR